MKHNVHRRKQRENKRKEERKTSSRQIIKEIKTKIPSKTLYI